MAALPNLVDGVLPVGVHPADLAEVERVFVTGAPFEDDRRHLFRALVLYAELLWERFPDARLWINGGFVTHKDWEPPHDIDVAVLVDDPDAEPQTSPELWTLQEVSVVRPSIDVERIQPIGGLIDGFLVDATKPPVVAFWHSWWQRRRMQDGAIKSGAKGFVEVMAS